MPADDERAVFARSLHFPGELDAAAPECASVVRHLPFACSVRPAWRPDR